MSQHRERARTALMSLATMAGKSKQTQSEHVKSAMSDLMKITTEPSTFVERLVEVKTLTRSLTDALSNLGGACRDEVETKDATLDQILDAEQVANNLLLDLHNFLPDLRHEIKALKHRKLKA